MSSTSGSAPDVNGRKFCEVANRWQYDRPEEAKLTASQRGAGFEAVGLTPWQPAFSVPAITGLKRRERVSRSRAEGERIADGQDLRSYSALQRRRRIGCGRAARRRPRRDRQHDHEQQRRAAE